MSLKAERTDILINVETNAVTKLKLGDTILHPTVMLHGYIFLEQQQFTSYSVHLMLQRLVKCCISACN